MKFIGKKKYNNSKLKVKRENKKQWKRILKEKNQTHPWKVKKNYILLGKKVNIKYQKIHNPNLTDQKVSKEQLRDKID